MKYALSLLCSLFFVTVSHAQQPIPANYQVKIDSLCNRVLKDQYVAGFAVAIVKGKQVVYSKGFGYRDVANKKPVTPNTLFAIGSSTKAFTSGLIGKLQGEGKLSMDNKATSYLPELQFFNDDMNNHITVRDLMCHRTGLSRYDLAWYVFNTANRDSLIKRVRYMEPSAPLRQKFQYNNFMFLAQGMIAEKLTGKTWEQNIKEKYFDPLEMKRSNTNIADLQKDTNASLPYEVYKDTIIKKMDYYNIDGMGPAGSINSSVNDMANWLKVWLNDGKYNGKEILPGWYTNEASSSQMVINGGRPTEKKDVFGANYGLGWMIASYRGHYRVEHGGNIDGFSASVAFYPTDSLGIVILTNQNVSAVTSIVRNSICDILLNIPAVDWNGEKRRDIDKAIKASSAKKKRTAKKQEKLNKPLRPLADYAGLYAAPAYGEIKVFAENDSLFATAGKFNFWLKHRHYDVFDILDMRDPGNTEDANRLNFLTGDNGRITGANVSFGNEVPVLFKYRFKEVKLDTKQLEKYTGNYSDGVTTIKVHIKDTHLYMEVPDQGDMELTAAGNHNFAIKAMDDYFIKFEVSPKGYITAITTLFPEKSERIERKNK
ncbi:MAG: DUF3471 domain-containing protein [Sphingobacteriales bacterium]|nr:MAG: DUF3471 domain-containing protein [Sphingobacteriales bacterium]